MDLIMLNTCQYDRSITDFYWNTDSVHAISNDAGRTLVGSRQQDWFYNKLSKSSKRGAEWRIIGNQIVFSRINKSIPYGNMNALDYDVWDGYQSYHNRTLSHLYDNKINNNLFLQETAKHLGCQAWCGLVLTSIILRLAMTPSVSNSQVRADSSPCPYGQNITLHNANNLSSLFTAADPELQWQDLYY
jgi:alkaline phosphatase D